MAFDIEFTSWHDIFIKVRCFVLAKELDGILQYSKEELKNILHAGSAVVIDVRTQEEYVNGHIPNVPLHTMQDVAEWGSTLNPEKSYVFVCRSGGRSQRVATFLKANGFLDVANYDGGMLAWDGEITDD